MAPSPRKAVRNICLIDNALVRGASARANPAPLHPVLATE